VGQRLAFHSFSIGQHLILHWPRLGHEETRNDSEGLRTVATNNRCGGLGGVLHKQIIALHD